MLTIDPFPHVIKVWTNGNIQRLHVSEFISIQCWLFPRLLRQKRLLSTCKSACHFVVFKLVHTFIMERGLELSLGIQITCSILTSISPEQITHNYMYMYIHYPHSQPGLFEQAWLGMRLASAYTCTCTLRGGISNFSLQHMTSN